MALGCSAQVELWLEVQLGAVCIVRGLVFFCAAAGFIPFLPLKLKSWEGVQVGIQLCDELEGLGESEVLDKE